MFLVLQEKLAVGLIADVGGNVALLVFTGEWTIVGLCWTTEGRDIHLYVYVCTYVCIVLCLCMCG